MGQSLGGALMVRVYFLATIVLLVACVSPMIQAAQSDSDVIERINEISEMKDEERLHAVLDRSYDSSYSRHLKSAANLKLAFLAPEILGHYGYLTFRYDFSQTTKTYGGQCTLYVDHVTVTILDLHGEALNTYQFDGAPGQSNEEFKTLSGACMPKTNEAKVDISQIHDDLIEMSASIPAFTRYEEQTLNDIKVVLDHITSLMWQQSG